MCGREGEHTAVKLKKKKQETSNTNIQYYMTTTQSEWKIISFLRYLHLILTCYM